MSDIGNPRGTGRDLGSDLPPFIQLKDNELKCVKNEQDICDIGYACDACPYNKDDEIRVCYCCHKEKKESEGDWIFASKDKTSGSIEKRFVCKSCNHIKDKNV